MNLTGDDKKTLKKLIESPDWTVYQKVVEMIRETMKEFAVTKVDPTESTEAYASKMRVVSIYVSCLDRIERDIAKYTEDPREQSVEDIINEFNPYKGKTKAN